MKKTLLFIIIFSKLLLTNKLFYQADNFKKSIEYYDLIFQKIGEVEFKHWPLLYSSGIALERGKNWERAEKQFLAALQFVPNK